MLWFELTTVCFSLIQLVMLKVEMLLFDHPLLSMSVVPQVGIQLFHQKAVCSFGYQLVFLKFSMPWCDQKMVFLLKSVGIKCGEPLFQSVVVQFQVLLFDQKAELFLLLQSVVVQFQMLLFDQKAELSLLSQSVVVQF